MKINWFEIIIGILEMIIAILAMYFNAERILDFFFLFAGYHIGKGLWKGEE